MAIPMHVDPMVRVILMFHVSAFRGDGSPGNPERLVNLYYAPDGTLLACHDPLNGAPDAFCVRNGAKAA